MPQLYLASSSPRRFELLSQLHLDFSVLAIDVLEEKQAGESAEQMVMRLAMEKARAGWNSNERKLDQPVLGADTMVVVDNKILGKPKDRADGIKMLSYLSGCTHQVLTAVAIVQHEHQAIRLSTNKVEFGTLSKKEIEAYWDSGEPADKAGAYGVQGYAAAFIKRLEGSYSGVMGLPLYETAELLREFNIAIFK